MAAFDKKCTYCSCRGLSFCLRSSTQLCPHFGFVHGTSGKEPTCQCKRCYRCGFDPWVGKTPWRRKWQPTPVLLPWKSHGWRSLVQATIHGVAKSRARLSGFTYADMSLSTLTLLPYYPGIYSSDKSVEISR